ncbi:hypothetical protein SAMN02745220_03411 [Desulfopila aestuarii DSM 18488]|uniref:Uncharacterized protein n=1 Tax=Desulfopila aestuarii DSM 18488 TaxID=1121416 RepID=A0A1M7YD20_9BACT|nr:hypothetical protein SAMN02745220_03411 [Desulfopila aestuarii DSM 18488]
MVRFTAVISQLLRAICLLARAPASEPSSANTITVANAPEPVVNPGSLRFARTSYCMKYGYAPGSIVGAASIPSLINPIDKPGHSIIDADKAIKA